MSHILVYHTLRSPPLSISLRSSHVEMVESSQCCEDMLMNFIVSHVTRLPPIKVAQRKSLKDVSSSSSSFSLSSSSSFSAASSHLALSPSSYNESSFSVKQVCVNERPDNPFLFYQFSKDRAKGIYKVLNETILELALSVYRSFRIRTF